MATVEDRRTEEEKAATRLFVVATDSALSGWGSARGGRSLYALACRSEDEAATVEANLRRRPEMRRVRICHTFPRAKSCDHLAVVGKTTAERHYRAGGF